MDELKLRIADFEDALAEALQDPTSPQIEICRVRTGLYFLKQMLKQQTIDPQLSSYCEQNPWEPECKIYDV